MFASIARCLVILSLSIFAVLHVDVAGGQTLRPGTFAAYRVGPGSAQTLQPITIEIFDAQGGLIRSIELPNSGPQAILGRVDSNANTGLMTTSGDGRFLVVPGYASNATARIALIGLDGGIDVSTSATGVFQSSDGTIRGGASQDGSGIWFTIFDVGSQSAVHYVPRGASSSTRISQPVGAGVATLFFALDPLASQLCVFVTQSMPISSRRHCYGTYPTMPVEVPATGEVSYFTSSYALAWQERGAYSAKNDYVQKSSTSALTTGGRQVCGVAALDSDAGAIVMATASNLSSSVVLRFLDTTGPTGMINAAMAPIREAPNNAYYKGIRLIAPHILFADGFESVTE